MTAVFLSLPSDCRAGPNIHDRLPPRNRFILPCDVTDKYSEQLRDDVEYRWEWAEKVGLGFVVPVCPNLLRSRATWVKNALSVEVP
jgi:hypothetical protein